MKIKSLMNDPKSKDYDANMSNHIFGIKVIYGDVLNLTAEQKKSQEIKNLLKQRR
jgi:hypothetical protein